MKSPLALSLLITLGWVLGCGQHIAAPKNKSDVSPKQVEQAAQSFESESDFLQKATREARAELELGQLAQSKSQNPDVKAYAERMVKDHTELINDLEKLARSQSVTLPTDLDSSQSSLKSKLESESGKDFDKDYIKKEIKGHEEMIALLQGAIERAQTPAIKDFATVNLITVRDHLDMARAVAKKIGA